MIYCEKDGFGQISLKNRHAGVEIRFAGDFSGALR